VSEPVAGKPYPERWPLRLTVYGGVVHAARSTVFRDGSYDGSLAWRGACGGWFHPWRFWRAGRGLMPKRTRVTCRACRARLAKPLNPGEARLYGRNR
jgi:hypothetical protein